MGREGGNVYIRHKERGSHRVTPFMQTHQQGHTKTQMHAPTPPPPRKHTAKSHTQNQDHKHNPTGTPHAQTKKPEPSPATPTHTFTDTHTHTHTYQAGAGAGAAESPARQLGPGSWSCEPSPIGEGRGLRPGFAGASSNSAGILLAPPP